MQRSLPKAVAHAAIFAAAILGTTVGSQADGFLETDLVANNRPLTDRNGVVHTATFLDPHLVNPWGLTSSPTSPFWVSDNGAGVSTLYNTAGTPQSLVVSIPTPNDPLGSDGAEIQQELRRYSFLPPRTGRSSAGTRLSFRCRINIG